MQVQHFKVKWGGKFPCLQSSKSEWGWSEALGKHCISKIVEPEQYVHQTRKAEERVSQNGRRRVWKGFFLSFIYFPSVFIWRSRNSFCPHSPSSPHWWPLWTEPLAGLLSWPAPSRKWRGCCCSLFAYSLSPYSALWHQRLCHGSCCQVDRI